MRSSGLKSDILLTILINIGLNSLLLTKCLFAVKGIGMDLGWIFELVYRSKIHCSFGMRRKVEELDGSRMVDDNV